MLKLSVKKLFFLTFGLLFIHLVILLSIQFTAWPEMLSYPYLFNNGFTLYKDFVYPYPPLLTIVLAQLYRVTGYSLSVLQLFTWVIILINDVFVLGIVKKLSKRWDIALGALALYVFTQPFLEGNQLWFDLALVPLSLTAIYFLLQKRNTKNLILSGIFFAFAALVKQTCGLFLIIGVIYVLIVEKKLVKAIYFALGPIIIGAGLVVYLVGQGILSYFTNWNLLYPFGFWSKFPGYVQMNLTNGQMLILGTLLFPIFVIAAKNYKKVLKDRALVLLGSLLAASFVMVYPRFSFFHFQMALALITIVYGYLLSKHKFSPLPHALFWVFVFFVIALPSFKRNVGLEARFWDTETIAFAQKLKAETGSSSMFLLGIPSSVYVFSNSLPPKPWVDNYGWYFEIPGVQEETVQKWENNKPQFVVWSEPMEGKWYDLGVYQPKKITDWIEGKYERKEQLAKGIWLWEMK